MALGSAVFGMALVLAQDIAPSWAGFHTWQYAAALAIAAVAAIGYALGARSGSDGEAGTRIAFAMLGAVVVIAAGIASGLLGPDTETVIRAPGTVAPLPDVGAAGFFPLADPAAIARGDARVEIRRRDGSSLDLGPGERRFVGTAALETTPQLAAYVEARDPSGARLTITQPTNAAFLSPVLFFPERITVSGRTMPIDSFAIPALHRHAKAIYFSKAAAAVLREHGIANHQAVLFVVDDDDGHLLPGSIGFVPSGGEATVGGIRFRVAVGTYPSLVISSVPAPLALWLGGAVFALGIAAAFVRPGRPGALGARMPFRSRIGIRRS